MLVAQPSLFDPDAGAAGRHTLWAYCHVPFGSTVDMTGRIEAQIERFAPGFRDVVLARHTMTAVDFEAHNANDHGGDITGGVTDWRQFVARPVLSLAPVEDPGRRRLPLLGLDPARRRRPRHVRPPRRPPRPEDPFLTPRSR